MKKLIDEADFDNVQQLSRRWKKDTSSQQVKQSISDIALMLNSPDLQKQINNPHSYLQAEKDLTISESLYKQKEIRKRNVLPQIIDEDTQHFKNRLQHLLNSFKTDAVSEFMGMKKAMLDNQKQTIKDDTHKYLTMYEQKHQQLLQTKQKLIQITKQAQKKTIQCELMSNYISKLNERIKITKYLSRPFSLLYENKQKQKMIKFKFKQASKSDNKRMKNKCFAGWRNIIRQLKQEKNKQNIQNKINSEVRDIVGRFHKQMQMLKEQLNQANRKNQQYENNKHLVQQNLKKAFLRGMCAMNMQAMGVLGQNDNTGVSQHNMTQMNMSQMNNYQQFNNTQRAMNVGSNLLGNSLINVGSEKNLNNSQIPHNTSIIPNNTSVMIGKVKTQSKQHKWKEAPILGVETNQQLQQPRPILVKPSTQGKVIKIIDGKSSAIDLKQKTSTKNIIPNSNQKQQNPNSNNINKSILNGSRKNI